jgi:hypothetical protein
VTDAHEHGHASAGGVHRDPHAGAVFIGRERKELTDASADDDRVTPGATEAIDLLA